MALSGDNIRVQMDNASGSLQTFADGDIISVDLGMNVQQHDVTGFGDEVKRFINGQKVAPVTIRGYLTTTPTVGTHTVIQPAFAQGAQVTLTVQVGQNATPTTGDPEYSGEFYVQSYKPMMENGSAMMFMAVLQPATGTAPAWGSVA